MAELFAGMAARFLGFSTLLLARLPDILTLAWSMAWLSTEVRPAPELLATNLATTDISQPTWLILQCPFPAHAGLLHEKWTFRARLSVTMAVVGDLRMATILWTLAFEPARWWRGTAGQGRLKHGSSTMTTEVVKNGFSAATARAFMAKLWAWVVSALQCSTTELETYVFGFKPFN